MNYQNNCDLEPRIYVASVSDYNAGRLHGVWIDCLGKDEVALYAEINAMLARSSEEIAEEFAIHDYENFGGLKLSEYEGIAQIAAYADLIEEHGELVTHFITYFGHTEEQAAEEFADAYCGHHQSFRDFSDDLFDELYAHDIPEGLRCYIDYAAFARDLEITDYTAIEASGGGVYVFRSV